MQENISNTQYEELISNSFDSKENKEKSIVDGKIVAIENDMVIVDVGLKSEGRIPLTEFTRPGQKPEIELGEKLQVFIESVDTANGEIVIFSAIRSIYVRNDECARAQSLPPTSGSNFLAAVLAGILVGFWYVFDGKPFR